MPVSKEEQEFVTYLLDMMQSLGPVDARRMFGGHGLFVHKLMFALVANHTLYLKVDEQSVHDFINQGLPAFTYTKQGKAVQLSYYQCPDDALEDSAQMTAWANKAYSAALRAAAARTRT